MDQPLYFPTDAPDYRVYDVAVFGSYFQLFHQLHSVIGKEQVKG